MGVMRTKCIYHDTQYAYVLVFAVCVVFTKILWFVTFIDFAAFLAVILPMFLLPFFSLFIAFQNSSCTYARPFDVVPQLLNADFVYPFFFLFYFCFPLCVSF